MYDKIVKIYQEVNGMPVIVLFFFASLLFLPASESFGFSMKGQDCTKCHTLNKDEASALLKKVIPDIKVLEVKKGPVKSMWEVAVESKGKKGIVYIDFSKKHLYTGNIIDIQTRKNLTQDRLSEVKRVDVSKIPVSDALVLGDRSAKYKIIVFDDPE